MNKKFKILALLLTILTLTTVFFSAIPVYAVDEDNPILSREELAQFRRVSELIKEERENNQKQNVTLRLSPRAVRKAKSLGKGYTSVLAKIVEKALDNPELTELLMK